MNSKGGEFAVGAMRFHVADVMVREIDSRPDRCAAVLADGRVADLATVTGECVFRADDIRIEQLGWLTLRRYVQYILLNPKQGLVAVRVE